MTRKSCIQFAVIALALACVRSRSFGQSTLKVSSPAFQPGQPIPAEFSCAGKNISPPLQWSGVPAGAKSLALVCEDPDAPSGTWTHWVLYNLLASAQELAPGMPTARTLPNGARQGLNDFGKIGYGGPCPPPGKLHHYIFKLYALDALIDLKPGAARQELLRAISGHVLAEGQIAGTYERKE